MLQQNAEKAVLREVTDLNQRFDIFAERLIWQALTGKINAKIEGADVEVDFKFTAFSPCLACLMFGCTQASGNVQKIVQDFQSVEAFD